MYSVTRRISTIKQPHGGYINKKQLETISLDDGQTLNEEENIHASLVGLAVDYLTRCAMGTPVIDAFKISLHGAFAYDMFTKKDVAKKNAKKLLMGITELNEKSIINACKMAGYDVCYRAGIAAYKPVEEINPDKATIKNIEIMVNRSVAFWEKYGPIIKDGFTFEGGYTKIVSSGDGDFLTKDTLWDFKVSKEEPKSKHTLQLLMYYLMGKHSIHPEFNDIKKLGIFNPRKNIIYLVNVSDIPQSVIDEVSYDVIGYEKEKNKKWNKVLLNEDNCTFKVGDVVTHPTFGTGTVLEIEENRKVFGVTVDFKNVGKKKIISSFLKLLETDK